MGVRKFAAREPTSAADAPSPRTGRFGAVTVRRNTLVLLALVGASLVTAAPGLGFAATTAAAGTPVNFAIVINGRTLSSAQVAKGSESYLPVGAGRLSVGARWKTDLNGTGYYVKISDKGSADLRRCRIGTACEVRASKDIIDGQEMTWSIQVLRTRDRTLVSQKFVCLVGKG